MAGWIIGAIAMAITLLGIAFFVFIFVIAAGTATTT